MSDNSVYTRIHFLRAASYSVGAHSALVHETNCDSDDDDDETTDAGKEVAEVQTADDPRQNDVCEVCIVAPRDTDLLWSRVVTSASVLAAWSKLNNSNSDASSVALKTRWCCVCSHYLTRRLTFLLFVRLSICFSLTFMNCDHIVQ